MKLPSLLLTFPLALTAHAQVFDAGDGSGGSGGGTNTTIVNNGGGQQKPKSFLGEDVPFMDPGSETAQWDGHMWNVTNNRVFRARFEKFLAVPEASGPKDKEYRDLLLEATKAMSPSRPGGPKVAVTMALLLKAADHPIDARLCDSLAQAVYGVVLHQRFERGLAKRNKELMLELKNLGWNMEVAGEAEQTRKRMESTPGKNGEPPTTVTKDVANFSRSAQDIKKMIEIDANRVANSAKLTASELKSKVEFQALIVQLFLQRRFEHVILACRLYRNLYEDGSSELQLKEGSDVEKMFTRTTGTTPTVSALDALSSEFIRDVEEGVESFNHLVLNNDLESASKRLSESFLIGEYLPKMRTLPRTQKQKVLGFVRDANQLISAIEVKDYTLAEELVERMRKTAKDFDYSKPRAAIEVARSTSRLHIQNARSAALKDDQKKLAESVKAAVEIWPTNPELKEFSEKVARYGDQQSQTLNDLDNLIAQKNFRAIWRDRIKYEGVVATSANKEYVDKLTAVLTKMAKVEEVALTSDKLAKMGNYCGAWEELKDASTDFSDDNEVNLRLAKLSEKCSNFINALNDAKADEEKGRLGISLSGYLRAERIYPNSRMAKSGIERLADKILPETDPASAAPAEAAVPVFSPEETLSPVNQPAAAAPSPR